MKKIVMRKFIGILIVYFMSSVFATLFMLIVKILGAPHWLIATVFLAAHSHICYYFFDQIDAEKLKLRKKQLLTKKIDLEKFIVIVSVYFMSWVFALPFLLVFSVLMLPFMDPNWLFSVVFYIIMSQTYYSFFIGHYEMITE